jgi:hypothetical protein
MQHLHQLRQHQLQFPLVKEASLFNGQCLLIWVMGFPVTPFITQWMDQAGALQLLELLALVPR